MSRWTDAQLRQLQRKSGLPMAPATPAAAPRAPKYGNKKVVHDGITFDSKKELARWLVLQELDQHCKISQLSCQVKFELIPKRRRADGVVERACSYVADFLYYINGVLVVEDAKGFRTRDYIIKRKLMLHVHGISVTEV